jgi:hypothetical protein
MEKLYRFVRNYHFASGSRDFVIFLKLCFRAAQKFTLFTDEYIAKYHLVLLVVFENFRTRIIP